MFRFHHHCHAGRFETSHERLSDLSSKIFLNLQATRETNHNARHLGKANHFPIRDIGDVRPSDERKQMMLTQGIKLDILDQNDLARIRLENSVINDLVEVLPITLREKFQGARCAVRGASQTFSIDVLTDAVKQFAVRIRDSVELLFLYPIALPCESFFKIEIGVAALTH